MSVVLLLFPAGHEFVGPDGQGYRLLRDITPTDVIRGVDFEPFGGAPEPVSGERLPHWLESQVWPHWPALLRPAT